MKIELITRQNLPQIKGEIEQALAQIGETYGIDFYVGMARFTDQRFTFYTEGLLTHELSQNELYKLDWERRAKSYGLKKEWYNDRIKLPRIGVCAVKRIKARGRDNNIIVRRVSDGKNFTVPISTVIEQLTKDEDDKG